MTTTPTENFELLTALADARIKAIEECIAALPPLVPDLGMGETDPADAKHPLNKGWNMAISEVLVRARALLAMDAVAGGR